MSEVDAEAGEEVPTAETSLLTMPQTQQSSLPLLDYVSARKRCGIEWCAPESSGVRWIRVV